MAGAFGFVYKRGISAAISFFFKYESNNHIHFCPKLCQDAEETAAEAALRYLSRLPGVELGWKRAPWKV